MAKFSRYKQNKFIFKFSVDSEVEFVSYARFTVLNCCIGSYVGNYYMNVDIINRQFYWLLRQTNEFARNTLYRNIMYLKASADVKTSTF